MYSPHTSSADLWGKQHAFIDIALTYFWQLANPSSDLTHHDLTPQVSRSGVEPDLEPVLTGAGDPPLSGDDIILGLVYWPLLAIAFVLYFFAVSTD